MAAVGAIMVVVVDGVAVAVVAAVDVAASAAVAVAALRRASDIPPWRRKAHSDRRPLTSAHHY